MDTPQFRVETVGDVTVAHVGRAAGSPVPIELGLRELVESGPKKVIVDTGATAVVGSWFLGHLLMLQHRGRLAGGQLRIACTDTRLRDVFRVTKLDQLLAVFPSLDAALAGF